MNHNTDTHISKGFKLYNNTNVVCNNPQISAEGMVIVDLHSLKRTKAWGIEMG